jgi:hypothetical protein
VWHSALQHLAVAGRTAPELQAESRHQHLASLGACVRLGEETSARITADADPPHADAIGDQDFRPRLRLMTRTRRATSA